MNITLKFKADAMQGHYAIHAEEAGNPNTTMDRTINLLSRAERQACANEVAEAMGRVDIAPEIERKLLDKARSIPGVCLPSFIDIPTLMEMNPELKPVVIPSFLREGETANIVGGPKSRKSWLAIDLATHLALGLRWLDLYQLDKSRVLYMDNELHPATLAGRFQRIAEKRQLKVDDFSQQLYAESFRGKQTDIFKLESYFDSIQDKGFKLIVLDALYRFIPPDIDENSNSQMTAVYNAIDGYATALNCAFLLVHHSTKGNQAGKSVTDMGAGAGAQSRAADTHIVVREHVEPDAVVLQLVTRSFAPMKPLGMRWSYPLWHYDNALDVTKIKMPNSKPKKADSDTEKPEKFEWTCEAFVAKFLSPEPRTKDEIRRAADNYSEAHPTEHLSGREFDRLLSESVDGVCAHAHEHGRNRKRQYATVPQSEIPAKTSQGIRLSAA